MKLLQPLLALALSWGHAEGTLFGSTSSDRLRRYNNDNADSPKENTAATTMNWREMQARAIIQQRRAQSSSSGSSSDGGGQFQSGSGSLPDIVTPVQSPVSRPVTPPEAPFGGVRFYCFSCCCCDDGESPSRV